MAIHPLQSSGPISVADIQAELGVTVGGTFSFQNWNGHTINQSSTSRPTPGGSESLSEWYGYNHNASTGPTYTQIFDKFYDPCDSQVTNLYEDSLGKYYLLVSGNYQPYSGYLYTYFGPASGNAHDWNASVYANGDFVDGYIEQSMCAPY